MLFSLVEAAAAHCLPQSEGLHQTIDAYFGNELRERKAALLCGPQARGPGLDLNPHTHRARTSQKIDAGLLRYLIPLEQGRTLDFPRPAAQLQAGRSGSRRPPRLIAAF